MYLLRHHYNQRGSCDCAILYEELIFTSLNKARETMVRFFHQFSKIKKENEDAHFIALISEIREDLKQPSVVHSFCVPSESTYEEMMLDFKEIKRELNA